MSSEEGADSGEPAEGDVESADAVDRRFDELEGEFRSLVEDVRDRVIQVKREADAKAPADHGHDELRGRLEQVGREVGAIEAELDRVDERVDEGFANYEAVLEYLTDTTDDLERKVGRLAAAVVDLRDRVGGAARDEVRRTALSHLVETANRHGVTTARCEACDQHVELGLLVDPRCPHCDASFSALEPKRGFFRQSVLHIGSLPALEAPDEPDREDGLEGLATSGADRVAGGAAGQTDDAAAGGAADGEPAATSADRAPPDGVQPGDAAGEEEERSEEGETSDPPGEDDEPADSPDGADEASDSTAGDPPAADGDLEDLDGVGPAYAGRLADAGVADLRALAAADPDALGEAIDVPTATVADWVQQAADRTGDA